MSKILRSCVGCGAKRPKDGLVRFIQSDGKLSAGFEKKGTKIISSEGRGSYICPEQKCVDKAAKRGRWLSHRLDASERAFLINLIKKWAGSDDSRL